MELKIQSVKFTVDQKLIDFINEKSTKLTKVNDKITGGEVILKLDNVSNLENKIAEFKIKVPGNEVFAKKQSNTFEEAIDHTIEALQKQLLKIKEKQRKK